MRGEADRGWNSDEESRREGGWERSGRTRGSNNKSSGEENLRQTRLEDKWLA